MVQATSGDGGKGDDPRPVNRKEYEKNYVAALGDRPLKIAENRCPKCDGVGCYRVFPCNDLHWSHCEVCGGFGYIHKGKTNGTR